MKYKIFGGSDSKMFHIETQKRFKLYCIPCKKSYGYKEVTINAFKNEILKLSTNLFLQTWCIYE